MASESAMGYLLEGRARRSGWERWSWVVPAGLGTALLILDATIAANSAWLTSAGWSPAVPLLAELVLLGLATVRVARTEIASNPLAVYCGSTFPGLFVFACGSGGYWMGSLLGEVTLMAGVGALLVLGLSSAGADAGVLADLRRGRCLPELAPTGFRSREAVDAVAGRHVRRVTADGLWFALPFMLFCTHLIVVRLELRPDAVDPSLFLLLLAYPLLLVWAAMVAYAAALLAAWSTRPGLTLVQALVLLLAVMPGAVVGTTAAALGYAGMALASAVAWACVPLITIGLCRRFATFGLEHLDALRERGLTAYLDLVRRTGGNRWLRPHGSNPIVIRETQRMARWLPGGLWGALAWRYGGALLVLASASVVGFRLGDMDPQVPVWTGFGILLLVQPAVAAAFTLGAVAEERQRGAYEALLGTRLGAMEFADGWASVALVPRFLENALVLPVLLAWGVMAEVEPATLGFLSALVFLLPAGVAYMGLLVSSRCADRRQAHRGMLLALATAAVPVLTPALVLAAAGLPAHLAWGTLTLSTAGAAAFARSVALQDLTQAGRVAGFTPQEG